MKLPLFKTEEFAALLEADPQWIRNLVSQGFLEPAVRGARGTGRAHRFSGQQAYGLAVVAGLQMSSLGCTRPWGRKIMDLYEAMPDDALIADLARLVDLGPNMHMEEVIAAWRTGPQWLAMKAVGGSEDDSEVSKTDPDFLTMKAKVDQVREALLSKYSEQPLVPPGRQMPERFETRRAEVRG